jgi:hypothetical protein
MVGALHNQYGFGRAFGEEAAVSGAWEQDAAAGFVEELFAAHHCGCCATRSSLRT